MPYGPYGMANKQFQAYRLQDLEHDFNSIKKRGASRLFRMGYFESLGYLIKTLGLTPLDIGQSQNLFRDLVKSRNFKKLICSSYSA